MSRLALSVQQPWAWLIVNGYKPVENRNWSTNVRGRVDIHAGKNHDPKGEQWIRMTFADIPLPTRDQLEYGGIVGSADLVDCVTHHDSKFFFGRYGFVFQNPRPCALITCRGQLGFFPSVDKSTASSGHVSCVRCGKEGGAALPCSDAACPATDGPDATTQGGGE